MCRGPSLKTAIILPVLLAVGGCELIAYQRDRAARADCAEWLAGCPILIDFSGEPTGGGGLPTEPQETTAVPDGAVTAGPTSADILSPGPCDPAALAAPARASDMAAAGPPSTYGDVFTVRPRATFPSYRRTVPRVWIPGLPSRGGYGYSRPLAPTR